MQYVKRRERCTRKGCRVCSRGCVFHLGDGKLIHNDIRISVTIQCDRYATASHSLYCGSCRKAVVEIIILWRIHRLAIISIVINCQLDVIWSVCCRLFPASERTLGQNSFLNKTKFLRRTSQSHKNGADNILTLNADNENRPMLSVRTLQRIEITINICVAKNGHKLIAMKMIMLTAKALK